MQEHGGNKNGIWKWDPSKWQAKANCDIDSLRVRDDRQMRWHQLKKTGQTEKISETLRLPSRPLVLPIAAYLESRD